METTSTQTVPPLGESSAPPAPEAPAVGFHEMSKPERDTFLREGKTPTREKKVEPVSDDDADSSTAPAEGEKAAEIAAKPVKAASEPAAPAKDKKVARNNEESRIKEVLTDRDRATDRAHRAERENDDLRRRIDALEQRSKPDAKTDSSTESKSSDEPKWKQVAAAKEFPKIEDFENPNEWAAAVQLHTQQQIESTLSQRDQASAASQQTREVAEQAFAKGATELEADPGILDRIHPELERLPAARSLPPGQAVGPMHFAKDLIMFGSDKPLGLMAFYSTPDGQAEWGRMMTLTEDGIRRTIIARDLQLGSSVPQGDAATKGEKKPVAKTFTKAPAPPEKEGPKGAVASDAVDDAVKSGDFAGLMAALDEREGAPARRYGRRRA